jgi:hypothetical protein
MSGGVGPTWSCGWASLELLSTRAGRRSGLDLLLGWHLTAGAG